MKMACSWKTLLVGLTVFGCAGVMADREWNYTAYNQDSVITGNRLQLSDVDEKGNASVRFIFASRVPYNCLMGKLQASVKETESEIVILLSPKFSGCETRRYTILKNGSGGYLDVTGEANLAPGEWRRSTKDLGLTPRN